MLTRKKVKLGVFDIDGTVFRSSLLIELIHEFVRRGIVPEKVNKEMKADYLAWLNRQSHYDNYLMKVVRIHHKYIPGRRWSDVEKAMNTVINYQSDRVYRFTRDLIKKLKKDNYYLIAISGSPNYIVAKFSKYFGFDNFIGQIFETKKGIFTGKVLYDLPVKNKAQVLRDLLLKAKINADFKNSIAIGDSEGDIPMLSMVGNPIAFNPHRTFAEYAMKNKFAIIVERKDAIYDIKKCIFRDIKEIQE
jgi:HAD superfamily hydrolase (TIGR01490 family)